MPIISFSYDKFLIEKKKPLEVPLNVDNGMKIVDIKEEDVAISGGKKEKVLRFHYDYTVEYKPNQAEILIAGNLVFFEDKEKLEEVMARWNKDKKLPGDIMQLVMNNVLLRCQVKALALGQDLGLPPHIRLPSITQEAPAQDAKAKSKAEDYIG
jgi:archaellin